MNKNALFKELSDIGMKVKSFEFSSGGYFLQLRLDGITKNNWEDLENMSFNGLELVRSETVKENVRRIIFIPANEKEFKDYIRRYVKAYNLDKNVALLDLAFVTERYGSVTARANLNNFKTYVIRRISDEDR